MLDRIDATHGKYVGFEPKVRVQAGARYWQRLGITCFIDLGLQRIPRGNGAS